MKRFKSDAGQALLVMALSVIVLCGFAGLGIDMGYLRYMRRHMQAATDSAALAGAAELTYGDVIAAAQADAATNGFTNGVKGTTITVNNPPLSGPHQGNSSYVEVLVAQGQPTFFMKLFGVYSEMVSTRAVAYSGSSGACVYALNPTASNAITVSGSANLTAQCGILDDSNNSTAALVTSGSGCISGTSIGIVGQLKNNSSCPPSPTPVTGVAPFSDPLAYLQPPTVGGCDYYNTSVKSGTQTLYPGVYCGGITVSSNSTDVTFSPGTYILDGGGLNVSGGANVQGNGVTFYNTYDPTHSYKPIVVSGGSTTTLAAPSSGSLAGILFFQDRNLPSTYLNQQNTVSGGSSTVINGVLYFPTTPLVYSGGSSGSAYTILVADTINVSGDSLFNNRYSTLPDGASPLHSAVLAE